MNEFVRIPERVLNLPGIAQLAQQLLYLCHQKSCLPLDLFVCSAGYLIISRYPAGQLLLSTFKVDAAEKDALRYCDAPIN